MVDRVKSRRQRCGASIPHEDADDGHRWCVRAVHPSHTPHMDKIGHQWDDGDTVEVTTVETVRASSHHHHDFVGDEDLCTRGCPLTWSESHGEAYEEWEGDENEYCL